MSFQGQRITNDGHYCRYRVKGQLIEVGPYPSMAHLLKENIGCSEPPLHATVPRTIINLDGNVPVKTVKE